MERDQHRRSGALAAHDLTVRFGGVIALDGVSLEVQPGEVLGVIGPNGAGKTTLFNVICGFVVPDSGSITWRGRPLGGVRPDQLTALGIARTLQGVGLFEGLTVLENVMVGAERFRRARALSGMLALPRSDRDERAIRGRAMQMLERMDCADAADRLPRTLPYALRKRAALARALVSEPELLMLDEPAGGLDEGELSALATLIRSLVPETTVMLVDHHMDLVTSVCDRVVVLDFGRLIAAGSPDEVRQDPRVLEAYLGREADATPTVEAIGVADAVG